MEEPRFTTAVKFDAVDSPSPEFIAFQLHLQTTHDQKPQAVPIAMEIQGARLLVAYLELRIRDASRAKPP